MEDEKFWRLIDYFSYSRKGYRKVRKGVKKRIARHMSENGVSSMDAYLALLKSSEKHRQESRRLLTVPISRFFRDRCVWKALGEKVFPDLMEKNEDPIRLWSAGCAGGEEAYTARIVWEQTIGTREYSPRLRITATDVNPEVIGRAKTGVYPKSSLKELPEEKRHEYFEKLPGKQLYRIRDCLRESIRWEIRDFLLNPTGGKFHVVFLRNNLLTYYRGDLLRLGAENIAERVLPGGWLVVGSHECFPEDVSGFSRADFDPHFYLRFSGQPFKGVDGGGSGSWGSKSRKA